MEYDEWVELENMNVEFWQRQTEQFPHSAYVWIMFRRARRLTSVPADSGALAAAHVTPSAEEVSLPAVGLCDNCKDEDDRINDEIADESYPDGWESYETEIRP